MHNGIKTAVMTTMILGVGAYAQATTIDFEDFDTSGTYPNLEYAPLNITNNRDDIYVDQSPQAGVTGDVTGYYITLEDYESYKGYKTVWTGVFEDALVNYFAIDYWNPFLQGQTVTLEAYNQTEQLISAESVIMDASGSHYGRLEVTRAQNDISYIQYSVSPTLTGDQTRWDNIEYTTSAPVPEPSTLLIVGAGLTGIIGTRMRKKKK